MYISRNIVARNHAIIRMLVVFFVASFLLIHIANAAQPLRLNNRFMSLTFDPDRATLRIQHELTPADARFADLDGQTVTTCRSAQLAECEINGLGRGSAIEAELNDRLSVRMMLFDRVPLLFLQATIHNPSAEPMIVKEITPLQLVLHADNDNWTTLGTAGLKAPDEQAGSYAFLAVADPATNRGYVNGWLTGERGSGILHSDYVNADENNRRQIQVDARVEYGKLRVAPGQSVDTEILAVGRFDDARLGLEAYADAVAAYNDIDLPPCPTGYCTWYSSPNGGAADQESIVELAKDAVEKLQPYGFDFVQIDDKWQLGQRRNGPAKCFFAVNPDGPYPDGMKGPAEKITALGLTPGIWFMPFAADREDPFFIEHKDWLATFPDGSPYWARWGGTTIDLTNPTARQYVYDFVHTISHDWGYKYFKMDGLWVGTGTELLYVNNEYKPDDIGTCVFSDPNVTNIEHYREGLRMVRKAAGDDVFFLGCCAPQNMRSFAGSFGLVDAMRIGPDNGANFDALKRGPWHGTNRYFLHGRVWYNDPDPIYMRESLLIEHSQLICSWVALTGQLNVFSEWLPGLPAERLNILRRTMPNHGLLPRPVDLFQSDLANVWVLTDDRGEIANVKSDLDRHEHSRQYDTRHVVGLFNWEKDKALAIDYPLEKLGLDPAKSYIGFDYWGDRFIAPFTGRLKTTLPAGTCQVLSIREAKDQPVLVSTSRHITQGVIDVTEEHWDPKTLRLSGVSEMVAGDPYELRILVPTGEDSYRYPVENQFSNEKLEIVKCVQNGPMFRFQVIPKESGPIRWAFGFEHAQVESPQSETPTDLNVSVDYSIIRLDWKASDGANSYHVERSDGRTFTTSEPQLIDTSFTPGSEYRYAVSSVGWDGALSSAITSEGIKTLDKIIVPPMPSLPDMNIAELKPLSAKTGWGKIGINKSCEENPLTILGRQYDRGYGVHANSTLQFAIPSDMTRLVATVGLDDEEKADPRKSVIVEIYGYVGEMGEPPVLLGKSPVLSDRTVSIWHFDLQLSDRFKTVQLNVTDAGDGVACDHLDWVNTGFCRK